MPRLVVIKALRVAKGWQPYVGRWKRSKPGASSPKKQRRIRSAAPSCARNCTEHPGRKKPYAGTERRRDESRGVGADPAASSPDKPTFPLGAPLHLQSLGAVGFVVRDHQGDHFDETGNVCSGQGDCVEVMIVDHATGRPAGTTIHVPYCSVMVKPIRKQTSKIDLASPPDDLTDIYRELEWLTTEMKYGTPAAADFARRLEIQNLLERWEGEACLLYTSPSPRDRTRSRMPSSA